MAGLQLSDEEQSERIKAWWRENGTSVVTGAVLGIGVIVGVNYWRSYEADQAEAAAALYDRMLTAESQTVAEAGQTLLADYSGTPYAGKAALLLAKSAIENGDPAQAATHLQWAVDQAPDQEDREVARLRLARVALERGDADRAAAVLSEMQSGGYESEYRELLGDIAMAREQPQTARDAYEAALAALPARSDFAGLLNRKLDAAMAAMGASQ